MIQKIRKYIPWNPNIHTLLGVFCTTALIFLIFQLATNLGFWQELRDIIFLIFNLTKSDLQNCLPNLLNGVLSSTLAILFLELFQEWKLRQAYSRLDGDGWKGFVIEDGKEIEPLLKAKEYSEGKEINQKINASLNYLHSNLFTIRITKTHSFDQAERTINYCGNLVMDKDNTLRGLLSLQNQEMNNYEVTFHNVLYWENDESQYIYLVNTKSLVSLKNNSGDIPPDMLYKRKKKQSSSLLRT